MPVSSLATDSDSRAEKQCWRILGMSPRVTKCEGLVLCVSTHEAQPPRALWPPREASDFELHQRLFSGTCFRLLLLRHSVLGSFLPGIKGDESLRSRLSKLPGSVHIIQPNSNRPGSPELCYVALTALSLTDMGLEHVYGCVLGFQASGLQHPVHTPLYPFSHLSASHDVRCGRDAGIANDSKKCL